MKKITTLVAAIIISVSYVSSSAANRFTDNSKVRDFVGLVNTASDKVLVDYVKAEANVEKVCMSAKTSGDEKNASLQDQEMKLIALLSEQQPSSQSCNKDQTNTDIAEAKKHESKESIYLLSLVSLDSGYLDYIFSLDSRRSACAIRKSLDEAIGQDTSNLVASNNKIADYYKILLGASDKALIEHTKAGMEVLKTMRSDQTVAKKKEVLKRLNEATIELFNDNGEAVATCDNKQTLEDVTVAASKTPRDAILEYILALPANRSACALRATLSLPQ